MKCLTNNSQIVNTTNKTDHTYTNYFAFTTNTTKATIITYNFRLEIQTLCQYLVSEPNANTL